MNKLMKYIVSEFLKKGGHVRMVLNDNYEPCPMLDGDAFYMMGAACLKGTECMKHYSHIPEKETKHNSIMVVTGPSDYDIVNCWDDLVRINHRCWVKSQDSMMDWSTPHYLFVRDFERLGLSTEMKEVEQ